MSFAVKLYQHLRKQANFKLITLWSPGVGQGGLHCSICQRAGTRSRPCQAGPQYPLASLTPRVGSGPHRQKSRDSPTGLPMVGARTGVGDKLDKTSLWHPSACVWDRYGDRLCWDSPQLEHWKARMGCVLSQARLQHLPACTKTGAGHGSGGLFGTALSSSTCWSGLRWDKLRDPGCSICQFV